MASIGLRSLKSSGKLKHAHTRDIDHKVPVEVALDFAFAVMKCAQLFKYQVDLGEVLKECTLTIKIGIHYGRALSGVIGYHKPQFSLIGDTVNTASRVCSNCEEGKITISEQGYDEVAETPFLFKQKSIKAKGKGELIVYQVYQRNVAPIKLRRYSTNDFMHLIDIKEDRSLLERYKKYIPFLHIYLDKQVSNPHGRISLVQEQLNVTAPLSSGAVIQSHSSNVHFLNSRRTTKQTSNLQNVPVKTQSGFLQALRNNNSQPSIVKSPIEDKKKPTLRGVQQQHRFSIVSQKKKSMISHASREKSLVSGSQDVSQHSGENQRILSLQTRKDRRWKTIHIDKLNANSRNDTDEENDDMIVQEVDINPEYQYVRKINPKGKISYAQTTLEIIKGKDQYKEELKSSSVHYSKYTLRFLSSTPRVLQDNFERYFIDNMAHNQRIFLPILMAQQGVYWILGLIFQYTEHYIEMNVALILTFLAYYLLPKARNRSYLSFKYLTILFYIGQSLIIFVDQCFNNQNSESKSNSIRASIILAIAVNQKALTFFESLLFILIHLLAWIILICGVFQDNFDSLVFLVLFSSFQLLTNQSQFQKFIQTFIINQTYEIQREQRDALITNLLPSHILTKFYQENKIKLELSDILTNATLLFADIAGFTAYSAAHQAEEVVNMLRHLMTEFDKVCIENNVYKVYTIGDCYVVLGVNDIQKRNPAKEASNVLNMALKMVDIIEQVRNKINFLQLNMRIGIHTGEFLGGVIGTDIVRYDIFGLDVLVANKMESNGEPGRVMISEDCKKLLEQNFPEQYYYVFNKEVSIPAAGRTVKAFFVNHNDEACKV